MSAELRGMLRDVAEIAFGIADSFGARTPCVYVNMTVSAGYDPDNGTVTPTQTETAIDAIITNITETEKEGSGFVPGDKVAIVEMAQLAGKVLSVQDSIRETATGNVWSVGVALPDPTQTVVRFKLRSAADARAVATT